MNYQKHWKIDLHMHSNVSDGTDSVDALIDKVKREGISLFSITDHDDFIQPLNTDLECITGIEFSCQDEKGKYHILGYDYKSNAKPIQDLVKIVKENRRKKLHVRLDVLKQQYGIQFQQKDKEDVFSLNNPGKVHIASLMVKYGYVESIEQAFQRYLNDIQCPEYTISCNQAIRAILESDGIPILAHPIFGSGNQYIVGQELEKRLETLFEMGLLGLEAYYSRFSQEEVQHCLKLADRYHCFVSAGSDYHGNNKNVSLADHHLLNIEQAHVGLLRFLDRVQNNR